MKIHPTAFVEDGAQIGDGCAIHEYAVISRHCILAGGVQVHPFAVIGGPPQDLAADPEVNSSVMIGPRSVIREHVTIHRATASGGATKIGADCFIMAAAHIAHDCQLGNHVVMANAVLLGGHVRISDHAFIGGGAVVHQHCRVGEGVMIGGGARISEDIPPYCLASERNVISGLNVVGLRRRGIGRDIVDDIKRAFHEVYRPAANPRNIAKALATGEERASEERRRFLEFFEGGSRRIARPRYNQ